MREAEDRLKRALVGVDEDAAPGDMGEQIAEQPAPLTEELDQGWLPAFWAKLSMLVAFKDEKVAAFAQLAEILIVMVGGSVEDERVFSAASFLLNKQRCSLDGSLEKLVRLKVQGFYKLDTFPYALALKEWHAAKDRRQGGRLSTDPSDALPRALAALNSAPSSAALLQEQPRRRKRHKTQMLATHDQQYLQDTGTPPQKDGDMEEEDVDEEFQAEDPDAFIDRLARCL